ncbi:MAG: DMT family transporter [Albidovulum sp.]
MTTEVSRPDLLVAAICAILLSSASLALGDALIKFFSADFALWQIFTLRSLLTLPVLLAMTLRARATFFPKAPGWVIVRSLMLVAMWVAYYLALPHLSFSVAAAGFYTLPIFITLFSAAFTGDRVGPLGWLVVAIGFAGVLLILRPDTAAFSAYAFLPLLSAILYAAAMVLTRTRCRAEHALTLSLALNLAFIAIGLLASLWASQIAGDAPGRLTMPWAPMTGAGWGAMAIMALMVLIGSISAAFAYQSAPPAIIGVFDFTYVGFAVVWGLVLFAELPDGLTVAGMVMIVLAGVLSLRNRSR